jgi:hypothetical protein
VARIDELTRAGGAPLRRGALRLCLAGALLAHLALLLVGSEALHRWQQERLLAPPVSTPMALRVRHLASAAATQAEHEVFAGPREVPISDSVPEEAAVKPAAASSGMERNVHVPRALLSVAPVARGPVLLVWPDHWPLKASYTAVLKLYLDEHGRVERVEPDGDAKLPEPLFESARQAFIAAGFIPGELNGQAVKSWIRVEVSFESETSPAGR